MNETYRTLRGLKKLQLEFTDTIPEKVVHSDSGVKTKARRNYFQAVVARLENIIEDIPADIRLEIENFLEKYTSKDFHHQPLTTPPNIEEVNEIVNKILSRFKI